jgi:hypothetical protein
MFPYKKSSTTGHRLNQEPTNINKLRRAHFGALSSQVMHGNDEPDIQPSTTEVIHEIKISSAIPSRSKTVGNIGIEAIFRAVTTEMILFWT